MRLSDMAVHRRWTLVSLSLVIISVGLTLRSQDRVPSSGGVQPGAAGSSASVVIAEVLFDPEPGAAPFVELLNTGTTPVDLRRMALGIGTEHLSLVRVGTPLAAGARLLVRFDGQAKVDGTTYHAPSPLMLDPRSGAIELADERNACLDRVAWGDEDGAVDRGAHDMFRGKPPAGRSIGRPPGANSPLNLSEWIIYKPGEATPGVENPLPRVEILIPFDGDSVKGPVTLHWYPVVGAATYRVQLARDESFAAPLVNDVVKQPTASAGALTPGLYAWRVQAIDAQGHPAPFSDPNALEVVASDPIVSTTLRMTFKMQSGASSQVAAPAAAPKILPVAVLEQRKDTKMLQLESRNQRGSHAWDVDHQHYDPGDPSDATNCVLASIAMINLYLRGDLSQDRIGYEVKSKEGAKYVPMINGSPDLAGLSPEYSSSDVVRALKEKQTGPEWDLVYGDGLTDPETVAAVTFAFGGLARMDSYLDANSIWRNITAQIDRDSPVIGSRRNPSGRTSHAFVVTGYGRAPDGRRFLAIIDPINGPGTPFIDGMRRTRPDDFKWFFLPQNATARRQEITVTIDTDSDGVVDFDEINRFHTDPTFRDSDHDMVWDKQDIASGVFDPTYGYAFHPSPGSRGRDFDGDGKPTELDPDSDDGGCKDGVEDTDTDGRRTGRETWNFDETDDVCRDINGSITFHESFEQIGGLEIYSDSSLTVTVALKPESAGYRGPLVNNGSRFRYNKAAQISVPLGGCSLYGRESVRGGGVFGDPGDEIGGYLSDDDELVIGAIVSSVPGWSSGEGCGRPAGTNAMLGAGSLPDCQGKKIAGGAYLFNCTTPPAHPANIRYLAFSMFGQVTLQPKAPSSAAPFFLWTSPVSARAGFARAGG